MKPPRVALIPPLTVFLALTLFAQRPTADPIDKTGLLEALKDKAVSSRKLVAQIRARGVSFALTPEDEERIRGAGKYLGKAGLEDLIAALRSNYRKKPDEAKGVKQEMKDSPGGIQVGGNLTINQGTWLMSRDEQISMTKVLKSHDPAKIYILMIGDSDSRRYASQVAYAFEDAGWRVEPVNYAAVLVGAFGVCVKISDPDLRARVLEAFKAANISVTKDDPLEEYPNAILVANKP